jgi:glucose-6-phosphate dehydrogenase assembly protein OpcA
VIAKKSVNARAIESELTRMWKAIAEAEERDGKPAVMRASSLNLVVAAMDEAVTDRAVGVIADVMNHHPVRAIVMTAEAQATSSGSEAQVSIHCSLPSVGGKQICCEQIMISARGEAVGELHSTVAPLLVTDLPVFLWWPGTPPYGSHFFVSLLDICDHLVVDSALFRAAEKDLPELAALTQAPLSKANLSDLNWLRLVPWRELTAQFFDSPHLRPYLDQLDRVAVEYATGPDDEHSPNRAQAFLLIGWLASRLGWETTAGHGQQAPTLQLKYGERAIAVEIEAAQRGRLEKPGRESVAGEILSLRLEATGAERPAIFTVTRARDGVCVITRVEVQGLPPVKRAAQIKARSESELLCTELDMLNRDIYYEEALQAARDLIDTI